MKLRAFDVCFRAAQRGYTADEIRPCLTRSLGNGYFDVDVNHPAYPKTPRDGCKPPAGLRDAATAMLAMLVVDESSANPPPPYGCGTELKALLKDWLGIEASPTCSCSSMALRMDSLGPDWCKSDEGMAEILGVMRTEHARRWADGRTILPWTDAGARQLVLLACRRARAKTAPENKG
jgi:hypothetical protein